MAILLGTGKKQRDMQIQVPCLDQNNNEISNANQIILEPRYTDGTTAASKTFTTSGDYADASNHNSATTGWSYDVKLNWMNSGYAWYNYTYDTNSGRRGSSGSPNCFSNANAISNAFSSSFLLQIICNPIGKKLLILVVTNFVAFLCLLHVPF